ncbi:MAG: SDR family NAD(P)-dependent oxidoreductase [Bacteroidales bacterium]|nr:SDR family NAD(P)-dependent oxidoreductase [Bacteroidales bacterium]
MISPFINPEKLQPRWALITGASSGIGLCIAKELGSKGYSLALVSNQAEQLATCAHELKETYGVRTATLCCDLCAPKGPEGVMEWLLGLGGKLDILVNDAGIFAFDYLTNMAPEKVQAFIDLHVKAVTHLSRLAAIYMSQYGEGHILNMSSMSCWTPVPGLAMYAATKAYIRVFSRCLAYEMRDQGITVTVAVPGGIATDLFGLPPKLKRLALRLHAIQTPEAFAKAVVKATLSGKMQYINGVANRIGIVLVGLTPTWGRMLVKRKMLDKNIRR